MSKILITGSSGFLGRIILNRLSQKNEVLDINGFCGARIDITKPFNIKRSDVFAEVDTIIHCAGKAHSDPKSEFDKNQFFEINLKGTENLCNALIGSDIKAKSFILISTVSVYGKEEGTLLNEETSLSGTSPYARSKILAEEFVRNWCHKNGVICGIMRLPLILGPNPVGNLRMMIEAITKNRYLSIGEGHAKKSIVWGEDVADAMPKLSITGGTYNLTDGYHPTFRELEVTISQALGKRQPKSIPPVIANFMARIGDFVGTDKFNSNKLSKITNTLTFDDSKARDLISYTSNKSLDRIPETIGVY